MNFLFQAIQIKYAQHIIQIINNISFGLDSSVQQIAGKSIRRFSTDDGNCYKLQFS